MSRPYRALYDLLRIPGALPRAGMYSPFRAGRALLTRPAYPGTEIRVVSSAAEPHRVSGEW